MRLVYITGSHSSGKSTLLDLLEVHLQANYFSYKRNPSPRSFIPKDKLYQSVDDLNQFYITFGILSDIISCKEDYYICDRFLIDNLAYSSQSLLISEELMKIQEKFLRYFLDEFKPIIFYLPLEFSMERDGIRPEDNVFRTKIDLCIQELLTMYYPQFVTLKGSIEERFKTLKGYV